MQSDEEQKARREDQIRYQRSLTQAKIPYTPSKHLRKKIPKCVIIAKIPPKQQNNANSEDLAIQESNALAYKINGRYRVYDMKNNQIIDGTFIDSQSQDAEVYQKWKMLTNATVIIQAKEVLATDILKQEKLQHQQGHQVVKSKNIPKRYEIQVTVKGNYVREYNYSSKDVLYQGSYINNQRHGPGTSLEYHQQILNREASQQEEESEQLRQTIYFYYGFWHKGIKSGNFLTSLKSTNYGNDYYEFSYGQYADRTKKGVFYYCSIDNKQQFHKDHNKIEQSLQNNEKKHEDQYMENIGTLENWEEFQEKHKDHQKKIYAQLQQRSQELDEPETPTFNAKAKSKKNSHINYLFDENTLDNILLQTEMLNNEICNAFGNYLFRTQANKYLDMNFPMLINHHPSTLIFDLGLMDTLFSSQKATSQTLYENAKIYTKMHKGQHHLFNGQWTSILFPFSCYYKSHFVLYELRIDPNCIGNYKLMFYDSMNSFQTGQYHKIRILEFLLQYIDDPQSQVSYDCNNESEKQNKINQIAYKLIQTKLDRMPMPHQKDSKSCGVFMCYFMECLTRKEQIKENSFVPKQYRKYIKKCIQSL